MENKITNPLSTPQSLTVSAAPTTPVTPTSPVTPTATAAISNTQTPSTTSAHPIQESHKAYTVAGAAEFVEGKVENPDNLEAMVDALAVAGEKSEVANEGLKKFINDNSEEILKAVLVKHLERKAGKSDIGGKEATIELNMLDTLDVIATKLILCHQSRVNSDHQLGGVTADILNKSTQDIFEGEFDIIFANCLGQAGMYLAMNSILNKAQEALDSNAPWADRDALKDWINLNKGLQEWQKVHSAVTFATSAPRAAWLMTQLGYAGKETAALAAAAEPLEWCVLGAGVVSSGWQLYVMKRENDAHTEYVKRFDNTPTLDPELTIPKSGRDMSSSATAQDDEVNDSQSSTSSVAEIETASTPKPTMAEILPDLIAKLEDSNKPADFQSVLSDLSKHGISVPEKSRATSNQLLAWLKSESSSNAHEPVVKNAEAFKQLYEKQKGIYEEKVAAKASLLNGILSDLDAVNNKSEASRIAAGEAAFKKLKGAGLDHLVPGNILAQDLHAWLSKTENQKELLMYEDTTVAASTRNALTTFALKKAKIDSGFLKAQMARAASLFTTCLGLTTFAVAVKVLAITIVGAASVASGFGVMIVLGAGTVGCLAYFYLKKPNLFKAYMEKCGLTQMNLISNRIRLAIQSYRSQYATLEMAITVSEIQKISTDLLSAKKGGNVNDEEKLKLQLKQKEQKIEKLIKHREALAGSIKKIDSKVKEREAVLAEAGWKDFQYQLRKEKEPGMFGPLKGVWKDLKHSGAVLAGNATPISQEKEDDSQVIAEFLLKDPAPLDDPKTKKLLQDLQFDTKTLQDSKSDKNAVAQAIRSAFAKEEEDTVKEIHQHFIQHGHG